MANSDGNGPQQKSNESARKWKKRPHPPVFNGVSNKFEDKNSDFLCPICFELISEAHMTRCGHTFCHNCIITSLEHNNRCPKCNYVIETTEDIFPNFLLNELITKHQRKVTEKKLKFATAETTGVSELQHFISCESDNLTIEDVNNMLEILSQKKHQLEADCREAQIILLKEFLQKVRSHKQEELRQLQLQIGVIDNDTHLVEEMVQANSFSLPNNSFCSIRPKSEPSTSSKNCNFSPCSSNLPMQDGFNGSKYSGKQRHLSSSLVARRKRMHAHFDDLEQSYLNTRSKDLPFSSCGEASRSGLDDFNESLSKFTRFSSVRPLATLNYANDHFNSSNIVSSIEFDKDNEYFAIAGVTKKIKVFEYGAVIRDTIDVHYPVNEMLCNSKISCISWSSYHKGMLASSDYEGTVTLWDAFTGQKVKTYQEHEKRCWSVDFNRVDTKLIASGSDDSKVKLWSTSLEHSLTSLEAKANVCCVKFNPESRFHLTF